MGLINGIEKHFFKPDVVDDNIKQSFVEAIIHAPPLTEPEANMISTFDHLEEELANKGKRVRSSVKTDVEKVRLSEERSNELSTPSLVTKTVRVRTFIQDTPPL